MMNIISRSDWDQFYQSHPEAHLLQSGQWGELKSAFGWEAVRVINGDTGAQILFRKLLIGSSIGYLPKGPIGKITESFLQALNQVCKAHNAVFLKIEPDVFEPDDFSSNGSLLNGDNVYRTATIQPQRTIVLSLAGDETAWLDNMKQKTRYNIRVAERKNVVVRETHDPDIFYDMVMRTGERDGFGVHTRSYYEKAYQLFSETGQCTILTAFYADMPLAGIMVFANGSRSWYFYGASTEHERNRMPAYLLQLEGMRWAASKGCLTYDLWGVPDYPEDRLESDFLDRHDGLWGVYRFKRGFGGELRRSVDAVDIVYRPFLYKLYKMIKNRGAE